MTCYSSPRVLDVEPESEDEDAIIERRRQLRQAIVQKYLPTVEVSSMATTPARSESSEDSDTVGNEAAKDLEETLHQAELKMKELKEERGGSVGPEKQGKEEKQEQKKSNIQAMKAAVRNGDMFSEIEGDMFGEKYLVSSHTPFVLLCVVKHSVCSSHSSYHAPTDIVPASSSLLTFHQNDKHMMDCTLLSTRVRQVLCSQMALMRTLTSQTTGMTLMDTIVS